MNPKHYTIVTEPFDGNASKARDALIEAVNKRIEQGWEPCGGVFVDRLDGSVGCVCQAMILRKADSE